MRCIGTDNQTYETTWLYIKKAWVPAITVCKQKLETALKRPLIVSAESDGQTPETAIEVSFGGDSSELLTFIADTPLWVKWTASSTDDGLFFCLVNDSGLDAGVAEEDLSLSSMDIFDENDLENPLATEDDEIFLYSAYWGLAAYLEVTEGTTYYVKITNPISGEFTVGLGWD